MYVVKYRAPLQWWVPGILLHQYMHDGVKQGYWMCLCFKELRIFVIQIKICADMLPRPRLVCQEPGLRPIGRSPGVPDKSGRGLGSMSRYSAQILICFIAYILLFFIPLWVWLGTLQDCQHAQCPLPLSIVIRMRLAFRQSNLPACLAEEQQNTLAFMPQTGEIDR